MQIVTDRRFAVKYLSFKVRQELGAEIVNEIEPELEGSL